MIFPYDGVDARSQFHERRLLQEGRTDGPISVAICSVAICPGSFLDVVVFVHISRAMPSQPFGESLVSQWDSFPPEHSVIGTMLATSVLVDLRARPATGVDRSGDAEARTVWIERRASAMRQFIRRHRILIPFLVAVLIAVPLPAWSDRGEGGEQGKSEAQEKAEMAAAAKVTIHDAIKAATQKVRGKVIEAELEEKPRATWEVEVLTDDGKVMEVWVDVDTGAVVSVEEEKPEKNAKKEQKQERRRQHMGGGMSGGMGGMMHGGCGMSRGGGQ